YATESFTRVATNFLILFEVFIFIIAMAMLAENCAVMSFLLLSILVGVIVTNLAVGFCLKCMAKIPTVGDMLTPIYILFYMSQNQVNPVSHLLFWTDLWFVLTSGSPH